MLVISAMPDVWMSGDLDAASDLVTGIQVVRHRAPGGETDRKLARPRQMAANVRPRKEAINKLKFNKRPGGQFPWV